MTKYTSKVFTVEAFEITSDVIVNPALMQNWIQAHTSVWGANIGVDVATGQFQIQSNGPNVWTAYIGDFLVYYEDQVYYMPGKMFNDIFKVSGLITGT